MKVNTNFYNCMNPQENAMPAWLKGPRDPAGAEYEMLQRERVRRFKESPDSFFPQFSPRPQPTAVQKEP